MERINIAQKEEEEEYVDELLRRTTDLGVFKMTELIKLIQQQQQQECDFDPKRFVVYTRHSRWAGNVSVFLPKITFLDCAVFNCVFCLCTSSCV